MGVLGVVAHSPEQLEIDLDWIEEEVGGRPYGVDLIVPAKYAGSDEGGYTLDDIRQLIPAEHIAFVDDILRRYDVPPLADDSGRRSLLGGASRGGAAVPFSANQADPLLEIALAHRPSLVVNALGPPPAHMIERAKQEGRLVGALAGKAQHAERHVNVGVDVIIAQGSEAGGHTGEVGFDGAHPRDRRRRRARAGARCRRYRARPSDGGRDGARRARCVVRIGVAHHRGGRDAPDR